MPDEFEGDLAGAVFRGAHFRDVDLTNATITHAMLANVDVDAVVDSMVINGADVTAYVNERDPWYPLRSMLPPADPDAQLHESVDGEWSFVQTMRHLVFAMDKWFTAPVLGESFHPMGLPNSGSVDFAWSGLEYDRSPSVAEALALRSDRGERFRQYLDSVVADDLDRPVDVLENGEHAVHDCLFTVFEEVFWHNRYARRDIERPAASETSI